MISVFPVTFSYWKGSLSLSAILSVNLHNTLRICASTNYSHLHSLQILNQMRNQHNSQPETELLSSPLQSEHCNDFNLKLNQVQLQIDFTHLVLHKNLATQPHLFKGQDLSHWTLGEEDMAHYFLVGRFKERLSYACSSSAPYQTTPLFLHLG